MIRSPLKQLTQFNRNIFKSLTVTFKTFCAFSSASLASFIFFVFNSGDTPIAFDLEAAEAIEEEAVAAVVPVVFCEEGDDL